MAALLPYRSTSGSETQVRAPPSPSLPLPSVRCRPLLLLVFRCSGSSRCSVTGLPSAYRTTRGSHGAAGGDREHRGGRAGGDLRPTPAVPSTLVPVRAQKWCDSCSSGNDSCWRTRLSCWRCVCPHTAVTDMPRLFAVRLLVVTVGGVFRRVWFSSTFWLRLVAPEVSMYQDGPLILAKQRGLWSSVLVYDDSRRAAINVPACSPPRPGPAFSSSSPLCSMKVVDDGYLGERPLDMLCGRMEVVCVRRAQQCGAAARPLEVLLLGHKRDPRLQ